jgi:hypothetical protein
MEKEKWDRIKQKEDDEFIRRYGVLKSKELQEQQKDYEL